MSAPQEPPFVRVAVVGLGLIGGSIALALRQRWSSVHLSGVDTAEVIADATRRQVVDEASSDLGIVADADLIVLAAPVRQNASLLAQLERYVSGAVVVTDTGSTKRDIMQSAAHLPSRLAFVGGHPLGGAAVGGLRHARADLFDGKPWILTAPSDAPAGAPERLAALVAALGATPVAMTAAEHDRIVAFVSHLPQLAASALMHVVGTAVGDQGLALAGGGLVDTTRLASSPADIWRDIAAMNADQIAPAIDALIAALQSLRDDLARGDRLDDLFGEAAAWRDQLISRAQL